MANNTIKILLIDDDADVLELISEYLDEANHELEFVIDHVEKFDSAKIDFSYDIYLVDDMFGGKSMSVEIAKSIRAKDNDSKVFILSGQAKEDTLRKLINLRVDGFIEKDDMDVSSVVKSGESISLFREQVERLNSKISRLLSM
tara:strand:- start:31553 stop:31984 length:432 start_codon:yes stop_codon:yes gene_type:complete